MKRVCLVLMLFLGLALDAQAALIYSSSVESLACNHEINDEVVDGEVWDTGQNADAPTHSGPPLAFPFPFVRCAIAAPNGSKYVEVTTICTESYLPNGQCDASAFPEDTTREDHVTKSAAIAISLNSPTTISNGTTYYECGFMRYARINSRDQYIETTNDWDKTLEQRGNQYRWIIGVGNPNGDYTLPDGTFTVDIACPTSTFAFCGNPDHKVQNFNGYSGSNPYVMQYSRWYSVCQAITAQSTAIGQASLFVNGTEITRQTSQQTHGSGGTITDLEWYGSIGQPNYLRAAGTLQFDGWIVATTLAEVQAAGHMVDPEAGGGSSANNRFNPMINLRR